MAKRNVVLVAELADLKVQVSAATREKEEAGKREEAASKVRRVIVCKQWRFSHFFVWIFSKLRTYQKSLDLDRDLDRERRTCGELRQALADLESSRDNWERLAREREKETSQARKVARQTEDRHKEDIKKMAEDQVAIFL